MHYGYGARRLKWILLRDARLALQRVPRRKLPRLPGPLAAAFSCAARRRARRRRSGGELPTTGSQSGTTRPTRSPKKRCLQSRQTTTKTLCPTPAMRVTTRTTTTTTRCPSRPRLAELSRPRAARWFACRHAHWRLRSARGSRRPCRSRSRSARRRWRSLCAHLRRTHRTLRRDGVSRAPYACRRRCARLRHWTAAHSCLTQPRLSFPAAVATRAPRCHAGDTAQRVDHAGRRIGCHTHTWQAPAEGQGPSLGGEGAGGAPPAAVSGARASRRTATPT